MTDARHASAIPVAEFETTIVDGLPRLITEETTAGEVTTVRVARPVLR